MPVQTIYLVRHGEAAPEWEDAARPLTVRGRRQARALAAELVVRDARVDAILHSGKRRAEETAEIIATALGVRDRLQVRAALGPNDSAESFQAALAGEVFERIMIVGHLPFLERLAVRLLGSGVEGRRARFASGTIVALDRHDEEWALRWMFSPSDTVEPEPLA